MNQPNQFELDILHSILDDQKEKYPAIHAQIPFLRVRSREITGVGGYINFELPEDPKVPLDPSQLDTVLTANKTIEMDDPPSGLAFAIDISKEKINFIEIVTYGDEEWNGVVGNYKIVNI